MLDIKYIRENSETLKQACKNKNFSVDIEALLKLDQEISPDQQRLETLQLKRNKDSKLVHTSKNEEKKAELKVQLVEIKKEIDHLQKILREKKEELYQLMLLVAQPAREDVPIGKDDQDNVEVMKWGTLPDFDFKAKDHVTLGKSLGIIDIEGGVKISGSRSYILKKDGALLESAILQFTQDTLLERGFDLLSVPVLVNEAAMEGTGYFPVGRDQAYYIEKDKMALIGTSEVPLCSYHSDEILDESTLPRRYIARTTCFRREAGTYGKDTKGLYRVHQFQKIEMFVIAPHDKDLTDQIHEEILGNSEYILQSLEIPYRKVYVCTGDLGQGQVRKHDLEAWMPSRKSYSETHSCSSFYDFQARRLKIRYKDKKEKKNKLVYTLNNTACASPRLLIPFLENHQTADGRIRIPECLRKYMGNRTHIG